MLFLQLAALAALAGAAPALKHVIHEERKVPSRDWVKGARVEKAAVLSMRVGLVQTNLEVGYDHLMEV